MTNKTKRYIGRIGLLMLFLIIGIVGSILLGKDFLISMGIVALLFAGGAFIAMLAVWAFYDD